MPSTLLESSRSCSQTRISSCSQTRISIAHGLTRLRFAAGGSAVQEEAMGAARYIGRVGRTGGSSGSGHGHPHRVWCGLGRIRLCRFIIDVVGVDLEFVIVVEFYRERISYIATRRLPQVYRVQREPRNRRRLPRTHPPAGAHRQNRNRAPPRQPNELRGRPRPAWW